MSVNEKEGETDDIMRSHDKNNGLHRRWLILALAVLVVAGIVSVTAVSIVRKNRSAQIEEGLQFLKTQESKDPGEVEQVLSKQKKAKMEAERAGMQKKLEDGTIDVWSLFGDTVIMGDSRAEGFYVFGYLPKSRVLADKGNTIANIGDQEDELVQLNPATLFLCYGLNDISSGLWDTKEEYVKDYASILDELHQKLPDTEIYVNQTIPAQQTAINETPSFGNIPKWSEAVHQMVQEKGYGWVDMDDLLSAHQDMYDADAIHMVSDFYPLWAAQMMLSVYDSQQAGGESEDVSGTSDTSAAVESSSYSASGASVQTVSAS
ncbi:MAG: GDSL-type esterase/lipase family protein [Bilifractor sp.]